VYVLKTCLLHLLTQRQGTQNDTDLQTKKLQFQSITNKTCDPPTDVEYARRSLLVLSASSLFSSRKSANSSMAPWNRAVNRWSKVTMSPSSTYS